MPLRRRYSPALAITRIVPGRGDPAGRLVRHYRVRDRSAATCHPAWLQRVTTTCATPQCAPPAMTETMTPYHNLVATDIRPEKVAESRE